MDGLCGLYMDGLCYMDGLPELSFGGDPKSKLGTLRLMGGGLGSVYAASVLGRETTSRTSTPRAATMSHRRDRLAEE
jgi:hypothetical protein